jgi:hypothetical protein
MDDSQDLLQKYGSFEDVVFFNLKSGESTGVEYLFAETIPSKWDKTKILIRYHLIHNGVEKVWDRASKELARQMAQFLKGDSILIKRVGEGKNTKYTTERLPE